MRTWHGAWQEQGKSVGMLEAMQDAAYQAIEREPVAWVKTQRIIRERLNDDAEFRRDMKAFTHVPDHVNNQQIEWFYAIHCYARILMGDVGACRVQINAVPLENSRMKENHRLLQTGLHLPFSGLAECMYEQDGTIAWDKPVRATRFVKVKRGYGTTLIDLEPWSAPLEIGYTHSYRSYLHLLGPETALARWCYGEDFIRIFRMMPHAIEERGRKIEAFLHPDGLAPMGILQAAVEQMSLWN